MEVMVVVIIASVLVALAVPTYTNTREKALDKEAITGLKLIRAANKQYFAENRYYFPTSGLVNSTADINGNLSLNLNATRWTYAILNVPGGVTTAAYRVGRTRTWFVTQGNNENDPTCASGCIQ